MSLSDNAVRWTQHVAPSRPRGRAEGRKVSALAKLRRILILVMVLADVLTLLVAMAAAYVARQSVLSVAGDLSGNVLDSALIIALGWVIAIAAFGGYDPRLVSAGTEIYRNLLHASLAAAGIVGGIVFLAGIELSRAYFLAFFLLGPPLLLLVRWGLRRWLNHARAHGLFRERVLIIGAVPHLDGIARTLSRERWLGYDIMGALTPGGEAGERSASGIPVLGAERDLLAVTEQERPDVLLFTAGATASAEEFRRTAWELEHEDIRVIVAPALSEIAAGRVRMRPVAGLPLVHMDRARARAAFRGTKRVFDVLAAAALLVVLAPWLAIIALRIRGLSGRPVLFRQQRAGQDGTSFELLKFRTLVADAEAVHAEMSMRAEQVRGGAAVSAVPAGARLTGPGRFLRRFSFDELPQLWNVVRGDMSLVGPRPALPREAASYDEDARRRLSVRPGITGLWQVSGRRDLEWEDAVRLDLYYVDNWSFMQDLQILTRTVRTVLASTATR